MQPPIPIPPHSNRQMPLPLDPVDELGGQPLAGSGFEDEQPEPDFEERS
jgi:hypothetical protein